MDSCIVYLGYLILVYTLLLFDHIGSALRNTVEWFYTDLLLT